MIELRKNHRRVVQAVIGLDLRCTSGDFVYSADRFVNLAVNPKKITFHDSAGVVTDTCSASVSWTAKQ